MWSPMAFSALRPNWQLRRNLMSERDQRGLTAKPTADYSVGCALIGLDGPQGPFLYCRYATYQPFRLQLHTGCYSTIKLNKKIASCQLSLQLLELLCKSQKDGYDLPAYDALTQILPDYQHLLRMPKSPQYSREEPREQNKPQRSSELNQTFEIRTPHDRFTLPNARDDGPHVAVITEHQTKELENYRNAMGKMAEDILALRSQVANLEEENSRLRAGVSLHRNLLDDTDIDVMTKTEIADRIVSLKFMLAAESRKVMEQTDKIQQLQNELIRKNDSEKELVELQRAHQQQQAELQHYQGHARKLARLEGTICQQEKVIERMEKVLETKLRERNKEISQRKKIKQKDIEDNMRKEIESVLAAENSRLREELERLRRQPSPVPTQQPAQIQQPLVDRERMNLLAQLERTEACIHTLNKQLEENARQWGREKQGMLIRLSEYGHGFTRTSSEILHDLPQKSVSDSIVGHVRHRHLKPLKRLNTTSQ